MLYHLVAQIDYEGDKTIDPPYSKRKWNTIILKEEIEAPSSVEAAHTANQVIKDKVVELERARRYDTDRVVVVDKRAFLGELDLEKPACSEFGDNTHDCEYGYRLVSDGGDRGHAVLAEGLIRRPDTQTLEGVRDDVVSQIGQSHGDLRGCTIRIAPLLKGRVLSAEIGS